MTYHGPHYSTFGFGQEVKYTKKAFYDCVMSDAPISITPSKTTERYITIQPGFCEGTILGGNLCTLNLLQGTPYMPDIRNSILFLEDDNIMGDFFCYEFDRNLGSLLQTEGADTIRWIIFGRFDSSCGMTAEIITDIVKEKVPKQIPVIFGADFGHVFPMVTFPIGGTAAITAEYDHVDIQIIRH